MGTTKSAYFTSEQNDLSNGLKALAHPARIAIIQYLLEKKSCICGSIVNELPLSQPTVSQHLKELKSAGLIKGTIEGNTVCYCIDQEQFNTLVATLNKMNDELNGQCNDCC